MEHQILVKEGRHAGEPTSTVECVKRGEVGVSAAEDVNESVAAYHLCNRVRSVRKRVRLFRFYPHQNIDDVLYVFAHLPSTLL